MRPRSPLSQPFLDSSLPLSALYELVMPRSRNSIFFILGVPSAATVAAMKLRLFLVLGSALLFLIIDQLSNEKKPHYVVFVAEFTPYIEVVYLADFPHVLRAELQASERVSNIPLPKKGALHLQGRQDSCRIDTTSLDGNRGHQRRQERTQLRRWGRARRNVTS